MPNDKTVLRFRHILEAQHPDLNWHVPIIPSKLRLLHTDLLDHLGDLGCEVGEFADSTLEGGFSLPCCTWRT